MSQKPLTFHLRDSIDERQQELRKLHQSALKTLKRGAVHDLRTTCRRLIAVVDLLNEVEPPVSLQKLRGELKFLQNSLRDVRDLQVERKRLENGKPNPAKKDFSQHLKKLEKKEKTSARRKIEKIDAKWIARELKHLNRYLAEISAADPAFERELRDLAGRHLEKRIADVFREAESLSVDSPAPLPVHELRKKLKRLRYAWEISSVDCPSSSLEDLQELLGKIQDAHVLLGRLAEYACEELQPFARAVAREQHRLIRALQDKTPALLERLRRAA